MTMPRPSALTVVARTPRAALLRGIEWSREWRLLGVAERVLVGESNARILWRLGADAGRET